MEPRPAILDQDALDALAELVGADSLVELCQEAAEEIARRLTHLSSADLTTEAAARIAHDLVGLAGQVGLAALASAAHDLQRDARAGDDAAQASATVLALGEPSLSALDRGARQAARG